MKKKKIAWLVNTILPQIAKERGEGSDVIGGWTVQLADILSARDDIELTIFYPQHENKENIVGTAGRMKYVGFYEESIPELKYNKEIEKYNKEINELKDINEKIKKENEEIKIIYEEKMKQINKINEGKNKVKNIMEEIIEQNKMLPFSHRLIKK